MATTSKTPSAQQLSEPVGKVLLFGFSMGSLAARRARGIGAYWGCGKLGRSLAEPGWRGGVIAVEFALRYPERLD